MTTRGPAYRHRQRRRNWVVFLALAGFAGLVYAVTIVRISLEYGG